MLCILLIYILPVLQSIFLLPFSKSMRLLDVSALSTSSGLDLTMVLEYIDQDLSTYLSAVPASGLSLYKIKVSYLIKVLRRHTNTGFV